MEILLVLLALTAILWVLLKMRELRENPDNELPDDEATLLLGLFYSLSHACIKYYKDRGRYPNGISGSRDGLLEQGYLKNLPVEGSSAVIPLFSLISGEDFGFALCLYNLSPHLANSIVDRGEQGGGRISFRVFQEGQKTLAPLALPFRSRVNLVLPLPFNPLRSRTGEE